MVKNSRARTDIATYEEFRPQQDSITCRQKQLLISLLYQNICNENSREKIIMSLDELTKSEASEQIQFWLDPK
jgi:hypothetical protein